VGAGEREKVMGYRKRAEGETEGPGEYVASGGADEGVFRDSEYAGCDAAPSDVPDVEVLDLVCEDQVYWKQQLLHS